MLARLLGLLVAFALLIAAAPAQAAFPGENGKIAFAEFENTGAEDIWVVNPDGTGLQNLTSHPATDSAPAWSPDGKRIAFQSSRDAPNHEIYVMNADGSNVTRLTTDPASDGGPAWSPDGTKIAFHSNRDGDSEIWVMNADGTGQTQLTTNAVFDVSPDWSPNGTTIAFVRDVELYTMAPDGSGQAQFLGNCAQFFCSEQGPDWSPDATRILYQMNFDNDGESGEQLLSQPVAGGAPDTIAEGGEGIGLLLGHSWSPDNGKVTYVNYDFTGPPLKVADADGSNVVSLATPGVEPADPDWQPIVHKEFARPKGATPLYTSLVLAYQSCQTTNRTHGPSLEFPSCNPPRPKSSNVTIGSPDANGATANFRGFIRMDALVGIPSTPADEADVRIHASLEDVRCFTVPVTPCGDPNNAAGNDYAGELVGAVQLRLTDEHNAPFPDPVTGAGPGTMQDTSVAFVIPCASTTSINIGGACSTTTTADALIPGMVRERDRQMWQLGQMLVFDGGPDGDASTAPDTDVFLVQGVHVP